MNQEINIPIGKLELPGILSIPEDATSIVVFAHSSGSSRFNTRNDFVANIFERRGFATLRFDLLTEEETQEANFSMDIPLQTKRLELVCEWVTLNPQTKHLKIGLLGAGTGAASALRVEAIMEDKIQAVVLQGGRTDITNDILGMIKAPTLLIVGEQDEEIIEPNKDVYQKLNCIRELVLVKGASHTFDEPGTLEKVAYLALDWFEMYLSKVTEAYEY